MKLQPEVNQLSMKSELRGQQLTYFQDGLQFMLVGRFIYLGVTLNKLFFLGHNIKI